MKWLFLLAVLLPLCHSSKLNVSLTREIISRLTKFDHLYRNNQLTITSRGNVKIPSEEMQENTSACMSVFKRELKHLLNNFIVVKQMGLIEGITGNLDKLQTNGTTGDERCIMNPLSRGSNAPFQQYINFLKEFNDSPARG